MFDSHEAITFDHEPLSTPSGDIRLVPEVSRLVRLAGQPGFAWVPGRQVAPDGARAAHGLRASFAPLLEQGSVGNGWHLHTSVSRDGANPLSGGTGHQGMTADGAAYLAGLLRDLPAIVAVSAPSLCSLQRRTGRRSAWMSS